jgi:hypothetical protein
MVHLFHETGKLKQGEETVGLFCECSMFPQIHLSEKNEYCRYSACSSVVYWVFESNSLMWSCKLLCWVCAHILSGDPLFHSVICLSEDFLTCHQNLCSLRTEKASLWEHWTKLTHHCISIISNCSIPFKIMLN